jgi:hypothetical protein
MCDGYRDGVGGIGLRRHVAKAVEPPERSLHLRLVGVATPVTACLTSFGAYSATGRPASPRRG